MAAFTYPTEEPLGAAVVAALDATLSTPLEQFLQQTLRGVAVAIGGGSEHDSSQELAQYLLEEAWVDSAEDTDFPYDAEDNAAAAPAQTIGVVIAAEVADEGDDWLQGQACSREDPECEACQ